MAQAWKRQMAWRRDVHVVPNMTPQDMVGVTPKTAHPLVVEVADAGSRKNIQGLLRAFRDVRRRVPDAELRLVGPGLGQTDPLAVAALGAGLAKGVTFLGAVSRTEVARHLSEAWVHAHAAFEESFGNTLVEAMALGTPVLGGSMSAAVPWVLDGGRAGLLSDVSDHRALAQDISDLLDDERARAGLAGAGLHRVQTTFSPSAVREGYEKLYQIVRTS
jgi:glycosyltransferase involved in cell wall biosynthesis